MMKNRIKLRLLTIVLSLFILCSFNTEIRAKDINQEEKLFVWMKCWNFLKYYHPVFAGGKIDADSFFKAKLPFIEKVKDWPAYNAFLLTEIKTIQTDVPERVSPNIMHAEQLIRINPGHQWYLNNKHLNAILKQSLLSIFNQRDPSKLHYVPKINFQTQIPNEKEYVFSDNENIPLEFRLLALAKLQGVMDYLYPHQNLMPQTSDQITLQNIPKFESCLSRKEFEILLLKIVANFRDTHAYNAFYSDLKFKKEIFNNTFYPPFDYEIVEDQILVTHLVLPDVCASAGIRAGDLIESINGESITERIDHLSKLLSASNRNALVYKLNRYATNFIWSNTEEDFILKLNRSGQAKTIHIKFISLKDRESLTAINQYFQNKSNQAGKKTAFEILDGEIAYFNIDLIHSLVTENKDKNFELVMDSVFSKAEKQKGMIFDMRGYPHWSGFIYHYLPEKFAQDENGFGKYMMSDLTHLGTFRLNDTLSTYNSTQIKPKRTLYTGKVIILVNGATLSMSEWQTMSLQHIFPQSVTIGTQSAGADGDEKIINIPGNYHIAFTGNAIYYPDGTPAQGKGVKINSIVKPDVDDLLSDKDTILNQAIKLIN